MTSTQTVSLSGWSRSSRHYFINFRDEGQEVFSSGTAWKQRLVELGITS